MEYLDAAKTVIPEVQQQIIEAALDAMRAADLIKSNIEYQREFEKLLEIANNANRNETSIKVPVDEELYPVIRSDMLNRLFMAIYMDMVGAYRQTSIMDNTIMSHQNLSRSRWNAAVVATRKLLQDVQAYRFIKTNPGYSDYILNTFVDARNFAETVPAIVDATTNKLILPIRYQQPAHSKRGPAPTTMTVNILNAGTDGISAGFEPKYAIDPSLNSFWAELIMTGAPIVTKYDSTNYNGLIVEAIISFAAAETFNTIKVLPFGFYEPEILDIRYSDDNSVWYQIDNIVGLPARSLDWIEFNFNLVTAKYLKVVFRQKTYDRINYLIPSRMADNAMFWERIIDAKLASRVAPADMSDVEQKERELNTEMNAFIDANDAIRDELKHREITMDPYRNMSTIRKQADTIVNYMASLDPESKELITRLLPSGPDKDELLQNKSDFMEITKCEYSVGAYAIEVYDREYAEAGFFQSAKMLPSKNVVAAEVDLSITHPGINAAQETALYGRMDTSVELELDIGEGRTYPILPYGTTLVVGERLKVNPVTRQSYSRFKPDLTQSTAVRKNGDFIDSTEYTIDANGLITFVNLDPTSIYTINYTPSTTYNPCTLLVKDTFNSIAQESPEVFHGTDDRGRIELSHYPAVLTEIVNGEFSGWTKEAREARWTWNPQSDTRWADGRIIGAAYGKLKTEINATAGTAVFIQASSKFAVDSAGDEEIGQTGYMRMANKNNNGFEWIWFSVDSVGSGDVNCTIRRGQRGTIPDTHAANVYGYVDSITSYSPVEVVFGNIQSSINRTDYQFGEHTPFVVQSSGLVVKPQFVQIGRTLYFDQAIADTEIAVTYRYRLEYLRLNAILRCNRHGRHAISPIINNYGLRLRTLR